MNLPACMLLLYYFVIQYPSSVRTCVLPNDIRVPALWAFHEAAFIRRLSLLRGTMRTENLFILGVSTLLSERGCIHSAWSPELASDGSPTTARSVSVSVQAFRLRSALLVSMPPGAGWLGCSEDAEDALVGDAGSGLFSWIVLDT